MGKLRNNSCDSRPLRTFVFSLLVVLVIATTTDRMMRVDAQAVVRGTFTVSPSQLAVGEEINLTVSGLRPAGRIDFRVPDGVLGSATVDASGVATLRSRLWLKGPLVSIEAFWITYNEGREVLSDKWSLPVSIIATSTSTTTANAPLATGISYVAMPSLLSAGERTTLTVGGLPVDVSRVDFRIGSDAIGSAVAERGTATLSVGLWQTKSVVIDARAVGYVNGVEELRWSGNVTVEMRPATTTKATTTTTTTITMPPETLSPPTTPLVTASSSTVPTTTATQPPTTQPTGALLPGQFLVASEPFATMSTDGREFGTSYPRSVIRNLNTGNTVDVSEESPTEQNFVFSSSDDFTKIVLDDRLGYLLWDRTNNTFTRLVNAIAPIISGDGNVLTYSLNTTVGHVRYANNLTTGRTILAEIGPDGTLNEQGSYITPTLSYRGHRIVFYGKFAGITSVYVRDNEAGVTFSVGSTPFGAHLSKDGRQLFVRTVADSPSGSGYRILDLDAGTESFIAVSDPEPFLTDVGIGSEAQTVIGTIDSTNGQYRVRLRTVSGDVSILPIPATVTTNFRPVRAAVSADRRTVLLSGAYRVPPPNTFGDACVVYRLP